MTCYDLRFPELARALVDAGADVLVVPAAWVPGRDRGGARPQGRPLAHAGPGPRDREHGVRRRGRPGGPALHRALDGRRPERRAARGRRGPRARACTRRSSRSRSSPRPGRPTPRLPTAGTAPDNLSRCPPPAPPASASPSDRRPVGPRSAEAPAARRRSPRTPTRPPRSVRRPRRAAAKPGREPRPRRTSSPRTPEWRRPPRRPPTRCENEHPGERVVEPSRTIAGTDAAGPVAAPDRRRRWCVRRRGSARLGRRHRRGRSPPSSRSARAGSTRSRRSCCPRR